MNFPCALQLLVIQRLSSSVFDIAQLLLNTNTKELIINYLEHIYAHCFDPSYNFTFGMSWVVVT